MENSKAKFEISETFRITGRGIVLVGTILEGIIHIKDRIHFNFNGLNLQKEIIGIDVGFRRKEGLPNTGLMIAYKDEAEREALKEWDPQNQIGIIYRT